MNALVRIRNERQAKIATMHQEWRKAVSFGNSGDISGMAGYMSAARTEERYDSYKGHLYSVINAIASSAAGQPPCLGRMEGAEQKRSRPSFQKSILDSMPKGMRSAFQKSPDIQMEMILDHPVLEALENPNDWQGQWQFSYSFQMNLLLTGRAYVIADGNLEDGIQFYQVPTSWVRPNGDYSEFAIIDPTTNKPATEKALPRENVGFAVLPNPSNPRASYAPAMAQSRAILIDQHIQTSQERFFGNGIFPSVVIKIGHDPHPMASPGFRPRLTGAQRRQIIGSLKKMYAGVANYGDPMILDGMVEGIERLSATQNEMGWEKSEARIAQRIRSAFRCHPFMLGEPMNVGGYAQAYVIKSQFYDTINTFLDLQSGVMTGFVRPMGEEQQEKLYVWYEQLKAEDPSIQSQEWREARKNGDVTKNEVRHRLGLPPDESGGDRTTQFTTQHISTIMQIQVQVNQGTIGPEQARETLMVGMDLEPDEVARLIPDRIQEEEQLEDASEALRQAAGALVVTPKQIANHIYDQVSN